MTTKKNAKIAKNLFKESLDTNGALNANRVRTIVNQFAKVKPKGLAGILKIYKRLIETAISFEEVKVESPVKIENTKLEKDLLLKTGARRVKYKINPQLVFGTKITHGDWIWEETLESKLEQLLNT